MTKRKTFLTILLGLIMALCLSFAVACGGEEEKVGTINWKFAGEKDHVTVTVDGSTDLPSTYTADTALNFTVTPDAGYEVTVMNGRITLRGQNGAYSFQVKEGNNDITITVTKGIKGISVTRNPTKMTYYAGETLDTTGMEVTVTYKTSDTDTEVLPDLGYVVNYPNAEAGYFELGDTSFTVTYGSFTSPAVQLEKTVVGKITVDPAGGEIEEAYAYQLKAMPGISEPTVDAATKVYSFTFDKPLPENIPLPTAGQITRTDFNFRGIQENGNSAVNVPANTEISHAYTAAWDGELIKFTSIKYEKKTVDGVEVPCLVFDGTFNAAEKVQLIFSEGNQGVYIEGPVKEGNKGEAFHLEYNMAELAALDDGKYQRMWLDTQFVSTVEGASTTYTDVQVIAMNAPYVDSSELTVDQITCTFSEYAGLLKTVVGKVDASVQMTYTIRGEVSETEFNLVFEGTINAEHNGNSVVIDYWDGKNESQTAVIENGKFVIKFDLNKTNMGQMVYFHFKLVENGRDYFKFDDENGNLLANKNILKTELTSVEENKVHGELTGDSLKIENFLKTKTFYVGRPSWDALVAYGESEAFEYTNIAIEDRDGKPYYVVGGSYKETLAKNTLTELLTKEWESGDISNNPDAGSLNGSWDTAAFSAEGVFKVEVDEAAHTFKLVIALPEGAGHGWILFLHISANNNFMGTGCETSEEPVTIGNLTYTIERLSGFSDTKAWINDLPSLCIVDETKPQLSIKANTHVQLLVDSYANATKVYYVVEVESKNVEIGKVFFGNSDSGELYGADATLSKLDEHGSGKLYFDITSYTGTQLWPHLYYQEEDGTYTHFVEIKDADPAVGSLYAIVGGRKYMLKNSMDTYYTDVCVVTEETTETVNPPIADGSFTASTINAASLALALTDNKVILSIEGTANTKYYQKADVKLYLYNRLADARLAVKQEIEMNESGNFTIKADLTDLPTSAVTYGIRVYFGNFEMYDVENVGKDTVTLDIGTEKSVVMTLPAQGAASLRVMTYAEAHKTYELTKAEVVLEDGKVYFVLSGTYEGYSVSEIKEFLNNAYFDFQVRGGNWKRRTDMPRTVEAANGTWKLKIVVSELVPNNYTSHFLKDDDGQPAGDGNVHNLDLDTSKAANGMSVEYDDIIYTLVNHYGEDNVSGDETRFWGHIGLEIKLKELPAMTLTDVDLATDEAQTKAYYVVTIQVEGVTKELLQSSLKYGDQGEDSPVLFEVAKIEEVEGGFKVYFDVTAAEKGLIWSHLYYKGANYSTATGDIKVGTNKGKSVTVGGKTYTIRNINDETNSDNTWGMDNLIVT